MSAKRKPRCFVAMAFDHEDTDLLYENAILPILRSNGITPIIINRREDNRDINQQIIEQLSACDFCIADLTYTRPSVYFEAGYAQRSVEVIYTVRADHLHKNQPDDLRVHFDLQMKPLIRWSGPDDKSFPVRLERRLKQTVLRQWNRAQAVQEKEKQQRDEFTQMPLNERLLALRKSGLRILNKLGYSSWTPLVGHLSGPDELSYRQMLRNLNSFAWMISSQRHRRLLKTASLRVEESMTLRTLRDEFGYRFLRATYVPHLNGQEMVDEARPVNTTVEHHVLCSLKAIPQARIMSAIPSLQWDPEITCYHAKVNWSYRGTRQDKRKKRWNWTGVTVSTSRHLFIHFVDKIQSIAEFDAAIADVATRIEGNQQ